MVVARTGQFYFCGSRLVILGHIRLILRASSQWRVREMLGIIHCNTVSRSADHCKSDRELRQGENKCNKASYSVIAGGTRLLFIRSVKLRIQVN